MHAPNNSVWDWIFARQSRTQLDLCYQLWYGCCLAHETSGWKISEKKIEKKKWFCQYRLRSRQIDILYRFSRIFKQIALDKIESSDFGVGFEPRPRCSNRTYDYNSIINHFCSVFPHIQGTCKCFVVGTKHMHVPWMCRHKWGEAKQQWFVIKL